MMSRRSRAVKRLDIQTLIKEGGGSNPEFFSFDAMAKQTPYRYSADAKEIIRNTDDFCKPEKKDGLKISLNQVKKNINSNRGRQKYDRAGNARRQSDRTETTAYQLFKASSA